MSIKFIEKVKIFHAPCGDVVRQQIPGKDIHPVGVDHRHVIVGIVGRIRICHHIIDPLGIDTVTDAFTVGGELHLVGIVVVFQESADQIPAPDAAQRDLIMLLFWLYGLWDLNSLSRDRTQATSVESKES